jgi:uracil-DNA glycosylase
MNRRLPLLLDEHRAALRACRRCAHGDPAVVPIVSEAGKPRVMLIGQAPGQVELSDRRPFAGRAGRTLFRWLERAGVDEETFRTHVYIAAITRCYPGPSASGRGDRVPSPEERAHCRGWLDAELRLIRPALLIPVGRLAIHAFIAEVPLDRLIGRSHAVAHAGGRCTAIPLPHPSGASAWTNMPAHRRLVDRALELLGEELQALGVGAHKQRRTA